MASMNWKLTSLAVALVSAALLAGYLSKTSELPIAVPTPVEGVRTEARASDARTAVGEASTAAPPPVVLTERDARRQLLAKYRSSGNGRALVLDSWQHPEIGGRFYASAFVDLCASVVASTDLLAQGQPNLGGLPPENHVKAIAAFNLLQTKCSQFSDDEYSTYSRRTLMSQKGEPDVLMNEVNQFIEASRSGTEASRLVQTRKILETADPVVMSDINLRLSLSKDGQGIYAYFDGEKYYVNEGPAIVAAYYLLPCGLGLACDATDPDLALRCITGPSCYADRFDRVLQEMAGGDTRKNEEILSMYHRMLAAVENRDAAKFVAP